MLPYIPSPVQFEYDSVFRAVINPSGRMQYYLVRKNNKQKRITKNEFSKSIGWFTKYIATYPEPVILSLKAYKRLLSAYEHLDPKFHLSDHDKYSLIEEMIPPANFENQLWLAGEMLLDGYDELSWATFSIGLANAKVWFSKEPDPYQALRIAWGMLSKHFRQYMNLSCQRFGFGRTLMLEPTRYQRGLGFSGKIILQSRCVL